MKNLPGCPFCAEIASPASLDGRGRIAPLGHDLLAMPTIGMLTADHTLLLPRSHVTACGLLPQDQRRELLSLCQRLSGLVAKDLLVFEHGMIGARAGGCGISHAHLHAMSAPPSPAPHPDGSNEWRPLASDDPFRAAAEAGDPHGGYLLWGLVLRDSTVRLCGRPAPAELPSQYLRKMAAELLGGADWDWRIMHDGPKLLTHASRLPAIRQE